MDAIIGMVLDRSGSMRSMWNEAVNGFNTFKNEQAAAPGYAWITLNYFDNQQGQKYFAKDAQFIPDLSENDEEIFPRSATALIDATIRTIHDTERWLEDNPNFDGKVFIVVMTDGMENASEAKPSTLKALVEKKESAGWEFIYLAANVNTEATARDYGFNLNSAMTYDGHSVGAAYGTLSSAVTRSRASGEAVAFSEDEKDVRSTT